MEEKTIKLDLSHTTLKIDEAAHQEEVTAIDQSMKDKTGRGSDFLGWLDYPLNYDKKEHELLKKTADYIRSNYDVLVVAGIGGSYLGARAAIDALKGLFHEEGPEIVYLGQTLDPDYVHGALNHIKNKKFAINVISKSGTTTETSVAFRLLREMAEAKYGKEGAAKAIVATTDAHSGALLKLSQEEGYVRFVLPGDIGGRYSVQTPVGLFPIAVAGIDPTLILEGSAKAREDLSDPTLSKNDAYRYALARHLLYKAGNASELLVTYKPQLVQLGEWWKQLFGESEGKEGKSLFPTSCTFTTDLHSLGQFIQEGSKTFFETILDIKNPTSDVEIPYDEANLDGLNFLANKKMSFVQEKAYEGTLEAHSKKAGRENIVLHMDKLGAFELGYLFYFFERACAMSAYLNGVNPFDQPGVEVYKKNMFHLLGKPGY